VEIAFGASSGGATVCIAAHRAGLAIALPVLAGCAAGPDVIATDTLPLPPVEAVAGAR
jgi:hypothetical protein